MLADGSAAEAGAVSKLLLRWCFAELSGEGDAGLPDGVGMFGKIGPATAWAPEIPAHPMGAGTGRNGNFTAEDQLVTPFP